jgi:fatty acid desaturase
VVSPEFSIDQASARAFNLELASLRKEIMRSLSVADFHHLLKIQRWGRLCSFLGYATAWIIPNPLSPLLMGLGNYTRWIVMHHVSHQGYDKVPEIPRAYTSQGFAKGMRRYVDWFDWMLPDAWAYEHNVLHHYNTGEVRDPDLVEVNADALRKSNLPVPLRYVAVFFLACAWKFVYYAPTTLFYLKAFQNKTKGKSSPLTIMRSLFPFSVEGLELWVKCFLPYVAARFLLIPLAFFPLGKAAVIAVLINSILAEIVANIYSFVMIIPNHTGSDIYAFDAPANGNDEANIRQIVGSVNYATGGDFNDFLHGWLNYQIEHHLWPELPMSKYAQFNQRVKALCAKYQIPYVQESVFFRLKRTLDILVGKTSMLRSDLLIQSENREAPRTAHHHASVSPPVGEAVMG